jgi:hypothetical protein
MNRPRQAAQAPSEAGRSGPCRPDLAGDPLVRALAVCVRQAHARRARAARLDS